MPSAFEVAAGPYKDIGRDARPAEGLVSEPAGATVGRSIIGHHHQDVEIAVRSGVATRVRAEQVNALRRVRLTETLDDFTEFRSRDYPIRDGTPFPSPGNPPTTASRESTHVRIPMFERPIQMGRRSWPNVAQRSARGHSAAIGKAHMLSGPRASPPGTRRSLMAPSRVSALPLPRGWSRQVRSAVVHAIALAHSSLTATRGWAANS